MDNLTHPPGIMLYLEDLEPIKQLCREDQGSLFISILQYGADGTLPQFDGMLAMAWAFVLPRIQRDLKKYHSKVSTKRYGTYCREAVRRGEIPISHELWDLLGEDQQKHMVSGDVIRHPATDTTPTTDTAVAVSTSASATRGDHRVSLSPYQYHTLVDNMGEDALQSYLSRITRLLGEDPSSCPNPYLTILGWWHDDRKN